jgi:hypothetical protein
MTVDLIKDQVLEKIKSSSRFFIQVKVAKQVWNTVQTVCHIGFRVNKQIEEENGFIS